MSSLVEMSWSPICDQFAAFHPPHLQVSFSRPLLIILDRQLDLATMLHHCWTYQALVHDTLDLQLNRVTVKEEIKQTTAEADGGQKKKTKTREYDLNVADQFWMVNKGK